MSRLPTPGGDDGTWGDILNDFLKVEHNTDGSQKTLPVSKGGTGATDVTTALTNLGAASSTDLAAKATDSNVVHKTGDETIAGVKTFSSAPTVPSNSFPESAVTGLTTDLAAKATPAQAQASLAMTALIKTGAVSATGSNVMPPGIRIGYASTITAVYVRCGTTPVNGTSPTSSVALAVTIQKTDSNNSTTTLTIANVLSGNASGSSLNLSTPVVAGDVITFDITTIATGSGPTQAQDIAVDLVGS